jgi:hypothetical protein
MDHAETVAQRLVEWVLAGARMEYHPAQSKGEHDFDLHYPDGRVSAVEVTSSVDKTQKETHDAIIDENKGGSAIATHLCKNSWLIFPLMNARISRVRKEADKYLAAIESAGIEEFWGPTDRRPSVDAIYCDLGVRNGSVASWIKPGHIVMGLPGAHGAIGASTVIEAVEREAFKDDNRRKLGAVGEGERHLAVYVYLTNLAWVPLVDHEPPPVMPTLPPEITDIWVFSEAYGKHEYVVWRASTSLPWKKLRFTLHI